MIAAQIQPELVIVIPTKNRRVLLERALESVCSQSYPVYRVVIINDGSTDGTQEYLDSLDDPHVQVIHHEMSKGVNAARNAAFKTLKKNEWAIRLDDDDMFLPEALTNIAQTILNTPQPIEVLFFNGITHILKSEFVSGWQFAKGETYYEPTYEDFMIHTGFRGDGCIVFKWTLFPKYLFSEDINGSEHEGL